MQAYVLQLVEDLENLAKNPPTAPYIEIPPHMSDMPDMAEVALSPLTSLEELTGISFEAMPNILTLNKEQWESLANALLQLLEALNMNIIDLPEYFPADALYNVIVMHWDEPLQYLPLAGYDIEYCTGNQDTCPYGEDCSICQNDLPSEEGFHETGHNFIGGLFNDDGTRIDPLKVPIPELCLRCKRYLSDDWEDDILCTLARNDQSDRDQFECYAFE